MIHLENTSQVDCAFKKLIENILSSEPDFEDSFNTNDLPPLNDYDKKKAPNIVDKMRPFFGGLDKIKHHALYYFELEDVQTAHQLKQLLSDYRKPVKDRDNNYRVVPASNRYKSENSKVLYLGVRQGAPNKKSEPNNLVGRINQHLGYYKNGRTQGLQLYHIANGLDFQITLKVYEFIDLDRNYLNVIEKMMAQKLKPKCGRH